MGQPDTPPRVRRSSRTDTCRSHAPWDCRRLPRPAIACEIASLFVEEKTNRFAPNTMRRINTFASSTAPWLNVRPHSSASTRKRNGDTAKLTIVPGVPRPYFRRQQEPRSSTTGSSLVMNAGVSATTASHRRDIRASEAALDAAGISRTKSVRTECASVSANSRISDAFNLVSPFLFRRVTSSSSGTPSAAR